MDRVLTFEDWIETYLQIQEEDLNFLTNEKLREMFFNDPKGLIEELRARTRRRREAFQFSKHLNIRDIPEAKIEEVQKKLELISLRENLLHDLVSKIIELYELAFYYSQKLQDISKKPLDETSALTDLLKTARENAKDPIN